MNNDEFAFFNQQFAAMVRDGIPLESALARLCEEMRHGSLRDELELLQADLTRGMPLNEAITKRELPDLYREMLAVGIGSNDLPGTLTMLADHFQRQHLIATRLRGLMVYPIIVLAAGFLLSCFLCFILYSVKHALHLEGSVFGQHSLISLSNLIAISFFPALLAFLLVICFVILKTPHLRRLLRWKILAFKEASIARVSSSISILLRSGVPFGNALGLMEKLERDTPAAEELSRWRHRLTEGNGRFAEMAAGSKIFPPLFIWTVSQSHEDLSGGFQRAAELYRGRARYKTELLLYSALPCSVLLLGLFILLEFQPIVAGLINFIQMLGIMDQ